MVRTTRRRFLQVSGTLLGGIAAGTTVTAAESTDRFIVTAKKLKRAERKELEVVHDLPEVGLAVVSGDESVLASSKADYAPDLTYTLDQPAAPTGLDDVQDTLDEPLLPLQWDKLATGVPSAHGVSTGEGARISIIDTGVDPVHPDLTDRIDVAASKNFTDDGGSFADQGFHGTHVAGIAAAGNDGEEGIVGVAPDAEIVACRVFPGGTDAGASFGDIVAAVVHSVDVGADVANLSLGAYPVPREELGSFYGGVLNKTMTFANKEGTLIVAAAGNDSADLQHDGKVISLPNEAAQVMSVSATGTVGYDPTSDEFAPDEPASTPAPYTNYGTNAIDVSAPGGNTDGTAADWVYSTVPTYLDLPRPYGYLPGTSMAAPQVAGTAALLASQGLKTNQIESTIQRTADRKRPKEFHGAGFLNVDAAVRD